MTGPRPAGRPWTLTDEDMLRKLLGSGMKPQLIAQKMKRSIGAVQSRIFLLKKPPGATRERSASGTGAEGEEMRATKLQELGEMAAKLLATAGGLPPGQDRYNALREVGRFRARITALEGHHLQRRQPG
jgi:hypothetical protein